MLLFVNGIYEGVECDHVGYWINDYESAFELLTQLVSNNWILQEATITDGLDRLPVPLEAIDGQPMQAHIRTLQHQWQSILNTTKSIQANPSDIPTQHHLKNWYLHLDAYYDGMLVHLRRMILSLETSKSLLLTGQVNESVRLLVNDQYDSLLKSNRRMYRQTKEERQKNTIRLQKIENESPSR
ncbi:hypothetical protein [Spirosoma linguale]|uniref:Uncharacterized protein n=1 Tax=Spirosoma linguale (strain ATCC 33905 / DSM 74 / LMG 10896 / Claus 1) TaxID=504472 RepID=D2QDX7_SPILD|nr:hypothetical protein Slin_5221 [Spirosoma linguale DSM 74]